MGTNTAFVEWDINTAFVERDINTAFLNWVPEMHQGIHGVVHPVGGDNKSMIKMFKELPKSLGKLPLSTPQKEILEFFRLGVTKLAVNLSESQSELVRNETLNGDLQQLKSEVQKLREEKGDLKAVLKNLDEEKSLLSVRVAKWKKCYEESEVALKIANDAKTDVEAALSKVTMGEKEASERLKSKDEELIKLATENRDAKLKGLALMRRALALAADVAKQHGHNQMAEEIRALTPLTGNKPSYELAGPAESSPSSWRRKDSP